MRLALNWHKGHTLPVLKRVVNYGIEDKAVPNRGWSPEFKHIHRLQEGMPMTQTAEQTKEKTGDEHPPGSLKQLSHWMAALDKQAICFLSRLLKRTTGREDPNTTSEIWGNKVGISGGWWFFGIGLSSPEVPPKVVI